MSELAGKRIIVIVEDDCHSPNAKFWRMLRARYLQLKGTDNEFEVVHICKNRNAYSYGKNVAPVSWLRHPSRHPPYRAGCNVRGILVHVFTDFLLLIVMEGLLGELYFHQLKGKMGIFPLVIWRTSS